MKFNKKIIAFFIIVSLSTAGSIFQASPLAIVGVLLQTIVVPLVEELVYASCFIAGAAIIKNKNKDDISMIRDRLAKMAPSRETQHLIPKSEVNSDHIDQLRMLSKIYETGQSQQFSSLKTTLGGLIFIKEFSPNNTLSTENLITVDQDNNAGLVQQLTQTASKEFVSAHENLVTRVKQAYSLPEHQILTRPSQSIAEVKNHEASINYGNPNYDLRNDPRVISHRKSAAERADAMSHEAMSNLIRYQEDAEFQTLTISEIDHTISCFINTNSKNVVERIKERLNLITMIFEGAFARELNDARIMLIQYYFDKNGMLKTADQSTAVKTVLTSLARSINFVDRAKEKIFNHPFIAEERRSGQLYLTKIPSTPSDFAVLIQRNRYNQSLIDLIDSYQRGNFTRVVEINEDIKYSLRTRSFFNGTSEDVTEKHALIVKDINYHYQNLLFDYRGIHKSCLDNSLLKSLTENDFEALQNDPQLKATFNEKLLFYRKLKTILQETWAIPNEAPAIVHTALYEIIGKDGLGITNTEHMIERTFAIISQAKGDDYKALAQHLFLPNGALKDFAQSKIVKNLTINPAILESEDNDVRRRLNHFIYIAQTNPETCVGAQATQGISFVKKQFEVKDGTLKSTYRALEHEIHNSLINNEEILLAPKIIDVINKHTQLETYDIVTTEFFTPNGIISPISSGEFVNSLIIPALINAPSQTDNRYLLNHLIYAQEVLHGTVLTKPAHSAIQGIINRIGKTENQNHIAHGVWLVAQEFINHCKNHNDLPHVQAIIGNIEKVQQQAAAKITRGTPGDHRFDVLYKAPNTFVDTTPGPRSSFFEEQTTPQPCDTALDSDKSETPLCGTGIGIKEQAESIPSYGCGTGDTIGDNDEIINAPRPACEPDIVPHNAPSCGTGRIGKAEPEVSAECNWSKQHDLPPLDDHPSPETTTESNPQPTSEDNHLPEIIPLKKKDNHQEPEESNSECGDYKVAVGITFTDKEKEPSKKKEIDQKSIKYLLDAIQDEALKTAILDAIKQAKHKASGQRCQDHDLLTSKGRHELVDVEIESINITLKDIEKLAKVFDGLWKTHTKTMKGDECIPVPVIFDYQHILGIDIEVQCKKQIFSIGGWHHDPEGKLRKSGLIDIDSMKIGDHGIYQIEWSHKGSKSKPSTFFPEHWSRAKVIEKIGEALQDAVKNINTGIIKPQERDNHRIVLRGFTKEGIEIEIILEAHNTNKSQTTGKIISAYPVLPEDN